MLRRAAAILLLLLLQLVSSPRSGAQSGSGDIILRPGSGATVSGAWTVVADASAAGGKAVRHPNAGAAKLTQAIAQPVNYFEQTFTADAGVAYRLWIRGRAQSDYWGNDSVFVQFDGTVEGGAAKYRIGSTSALRSQPGGLFGLWAGRLGLAGHGLGRRRARPGGGLRARRARNASASRRVRTVSPSIRSCSRPRAI